ncbi:ATG13 family [Rhizoctonia solani]|uniref:Autophagy-related protein 13 n=1 Tax=Rhizoctonia solani TaxID=456999 RepID=A0A8H7H216_9AGAM|nr:ATG13 family [Rhizoctonia solani]
MAGRGEQIISRLFVKSALLISDARENQSARPASGAKPDKWFQLEVMDDGRFGGLTQELRDLGNAASGPLELRVRSILVLGPPSPAQALVLVSDSERRKRVEIPPEARAIQLEEWSLSLDRSTRLDSAQAGEEPYPAVYKQAIALMRSLYAVLRVMVIATLVGREEDALHEEVLALTHKLIPDEGDLITFSFPPIVTPLGAIALRAQYRPNVRFRLDPLESLWSSALATPSSPGGAGTGRGSTSPASPSPPAPKFDLDSPAFTPTLLATRQRASLTGSGSPLRPASRTGTSPGTVAAPLPPRTRTISQLSAGGDTPRSPPPGADFYGGASGLTRTRRESLLTRGSVSGSVTPSGLAPGPPSSPRRTSGTINPFKGATLASSPRTLGMGASPLGGGSPRTTPGLGLGTSPRAGIAVAIGAGTGTSPLSAGAGAGTGSSPRGTESDGRRSMDSGDGTRLNAQPQPIKRYSSSFGHRPGRSESSLGSAGLAGGNGSVGAIAVGSLGAGSTGGAPGSVDAGSTGSGGQGGGAGAGPHSRLSTIGSQSYLSHAADDDDLGQFIKEIDTRPQLGSEGSPLSPDTAISTEQFPLSSPAQEQFPRRAERFPSISQTERFPPSSLPTTYSALPHLSPLGRTYEQSLQPFGSRPNEGIAQNLTDSPRPLPPPLESVPPSPAESAWQMRSRSRERFGSSERRTSIDNRYGVRGPSTSRERRPMEVLAPLPERLGLGLEERTRTMSLGPTAAPREAPSSLFTGSPFITGRTASPFNHERARTTSLTPVHGRSLTPSHERERTISFTRRNRTLLTRRDEVDAEIERMKESFQASYAPASPREPASRGLGLEPTLRIGDGSSGSGSGSGTRRIGSEEVVGRLELGESSGLGFGARGSVRPGRDTDGWKDGGEWDKRMNGWR